MTTLTEGERISYAAGFKAGMAKMAADLGASVRTPNCTHPPSQVIYDRPLTQEQLHRVRAMVEGMPAEKVAVLTGGRYRVIECSWCRNPEMPWLSSTLESTEP